MACVARNDYGTAIAPLAYPGGCVQQEAAANLFRVGSVALKAVLLEDGLNSFVEKPDAFIGSLRHGLKPKDRQETTRAQGQFPIALHAEMVLRDLDGTDPKSQSDWHLSRPSQAIT